MNIDESEIEIFDEEQCREVVIDVIQNASGGCIAEDILNKQQRIGRKKLFRILADLKKENVIIEGEKSKSKVRYKKLLVNGSNPLAVVLNELKEFEKIYYCILEETVVIGNKKRTDAISALEQDVEEPPYIDLLSATDLMWQPLHIFVEFLKVFLARLIIVWSKVIQDQDVINKLYSMIFAKFAYIQTHSYKMVASSILEEINSSLIRSTYSVMKRNTNQKIKDHIQSLKKYGMEEEANKLLKFLEGISASDGIREYFYAENKPYRWDLKYKDDELDALAEDINRHQDYIYDAYYDDYMSSIEE